MYKSVILVLAKEDVKKTASWYYEKQKKLGRIFTEQVRKKIHFIQQNPYVYRVRYDNVRTAILETFPFMVHYTIDEKNRTIIISAVLHTSRDLDLWKKR